MADEATRYKVWDNVNKEYLPADYSSRQRANTSASQKDIDFGSSRYSVDSINYKDGAWRGRNDQATQVRGGHALAEKLGVGPSAEEIDQRKKNVAASIENFPRKLEEIKKPKSGGGGGGVSDNREIQLGSDLDPKAMMKREGYKNGGKVRTASQRADGCAIRGKTRA